MFLAVGNAGFISSTVVKGTAQGCRVQEVYCSRLQGFMWAGEYLCSSSDIKSKVTKKRELHRRP